MLGHDTGDRVLRETARLLTRGVRSSDFVGRLGGDEFVVIFWHSRPAAAARRLSGQCARIAELVPDQARAAGFGASYGVVSITHGSTVASLLQDADRQMYRRKAGRKGGSPRRNPPPAGSGHGRGGSFDPDAPAPDGADAPNVHPSVPAGSGRSDNSRVDIPRGRS
jgi:GGDEF domain-containing protein